MPILILKEQTQSSSKRANNSLIQTTSLKKYKPIVKLEYAKMVQEDVGSDSQTEVNLISYLHILEIRLRFFEGKRNTCCCSK